VLDYLDDLDADFLRYYGREWWEMTGPRFFSRAERVAAYGGVLAYRIRSEAEGAEADEVDDLADLGDLIDM
jgi:hypothetical protein